MAGELAGVNCILTGASRGFGVELSKELSRRGANLLLVARDRTRLEQQREVLSSGEGPSSEVLICVADLADPASPARIVEQARRHWDGIGAVINNAAIQGPIGGLWENDWEEWSRTIQVNLLAPAALCRLAVPWMRETGGGSIVNLSGGGGTGPRARFSAYATSKAGLIRFSETLAMEVAPFGIRVNCVAPGAMNTDMLREVLAAGPAAAGESEYEQACRRQSSGGDPPRNAAELISFLLSPASAGISGRILSAVWDPWRELGHRSEELRDTDIYTLRRITPADRGRNWEAQRGRP